LELAIEDKAATLNINCSKTEPTHSTMSEPQQPKRLSFDQCTELSALCPVEATVLGYAPNFGASIFFAVCFGILLIIALTVSVWKRTWSYGAAISVGLLLELCGTWQRCFVLVVI
jgi:hypothetical protein